ncbi:MAG TPA: F0F1 ATP synthase subunit B [Myxococcaceae bacterium]|nr:F0F1 ATP synthase subunit B [Myxococcaceae bacterium]
MPLPLLVAASFVDVRPGLIFWTLVTFILVFVVLRWKAWGPILTVAEEREKQITNAIESAKRERAEAEKLLAEQKTAIADARREAAESLRKNQAEMEAFRNELMARSREEADALKESARREIQEERAKAVAELKAQSADLAIAIAGKLLNERLDDAKQRELAQQFAQSLATERAQA